MKKINESFTTVLAITAAVAIVTSSCRVTSGINNDSSKSGGVSKIADVKVALPPAGQFKPSQGSAVVNTIQLTVKPKDSGCAGATLLNATIAYNNPTLSEKFHKGCDYVVTLAIGERVGGTGPLKAYYHSGDTAVAAADLEKVPATINLNLTLTAEGQAAGMPASLAAIPTTPNTPPATPNGLQALAPSIAVDLTQMSGNQSKSVPLASLFTTQYLVLDYSQPGCGPCMEHAAKMNQADYAQRFSGKGKCTSIVMVESSLLGGWKDIYADSTFVGAHSFSYPKGSLNSFSSLFGGPSITGTPTFMIVDRTGKLIGSDVGQEPKEVESLCN